MRQRPTAGSVAAMTSDNLHDQILSRLLCDAWAKVAADPDVPANRRLDALATSMSDVQEAAAALRMIADDLAVTSSPEAVRARAAQTDAARRAADAAEKAETDRVLRQIERTTGRETLDAARRDLAEATQEHERAEKGEAPARERLLLKGARLEAEARVTAAEAALRKLGVEP